MNKKKPQTRWLWVMRSIALLALIFSIYSYFRQNQKIAQQKVELTLLQDESAQNARKNQELMKRLEYMNSERYIQDAARQKLGMVLEGEIIYYERKSEDTPNSTQITP